VECIRYNYANVYYYYCGRLARVECRMLDAITSAF